MNESLCLCGCGCEVVQKPTGRPSQYASPACRVRVHRSKDVTKLSPDVTKLDKKVVELRSPLKRIGGKSAAADRIVSLFPSPSSYTRYCEPCGGAAHVILAKPRYRHEEIFNDLDGNLIAFWMEMLTNADGLHSWLEKMPYSYELYCVHYRSLFDGSALSQFERAWKYFYCLRQTGTGWLRKSKVGWDCRANNVRSFRSAIETFPIVQERLGKDRPLFPAILTNLLTSGILQRNGDVSHGNSISHQIFRVQLQHWQRKCYFVTISHSTRHSGRFLR